MRSLPVWLLLILALPIGVIAVTSPIEMDRTTHENLFLGLGAACFVIGFGALSIVAIRSSRLRKQAGQISETVQLGDDVASALFMATLIDALALFTAGRVLQLGLIFSGAGILWTLAWLPRWMRHLGIRTAVTIGRDQSTVFSFLADMSNGPKYLPELESVEKVTDGPIGQGTRFRSRMRLPSGVFEGVEEIIDYQPPNQMTSRLMTALRPNVDVLGFESVPEGTRVTHRFDSEITYPAALLNQGVMRPLMVLDMKSRRNAAWKRLKEILESPSPT